MQSWHPNVNNISFVIVDQLYNGWNTNQCLALINRAGGLYGRILTSVVCTDLTAFGLYSRPRSRFSHTDRLSLVNKMFIIWRQQEQFNVTGL